MSFPVSKSRAKQIRKLRSSTGFKGFKPQLTSMIDAMTVLIIYLLQSFSAEGDIITVSKNLQLPASSAQKKPAVTVNITVNNEYILAENQLIARVDDVLASEELVIEPLNAFLQDRRETTEKISAYSTTTKFKGDITIQGDKRIRFRLLKKIMYTCGQQGFNNFALLVEKKEG